MANSKVIATSVTIFFSFYRRILSPALTTAFGIRCRFEESCSIYTERMISEQGVIRGSLTGLRRFFLCNPFFDPKN